MVLFVCTWGSTAWSSMGLVLWPLLPDPYPSIHESSPGVWGQLCKQCCLSSRRTLLLTMPRRASTLSRSNMQSLLWAWELWASPGTCSSHDRQQPYMYFTIKKTPISPLPFILAEFKMLVPWMKPHDGQGKRWWDFAKLSEVSRRRTLRTENRKPQGRDKRKDSGVNGVPQMWSCWRRKRAQHGEGGAATMWRSNNGAGRRQAVPVQPTPEARQLLQCDQVSSELIPCVIPVKPTVLHLGLTQLTNTRATFQHLSFRAFP